MGRLLSSRRGIIQSNTQTLATLYSHCPTTQNKKSRKMKAVEDALKTSTNHYIQLEALSYLLYGTALWVIRTGWTTYSLTYTNHWSVVSCWVDNYTALSSINPFHSTSLSASLCFHSKRACYQHRLYQTTSGLLRKFKSGKILQNMSTCARLDMQSVWGPTVGVVYSHFATKGRVKPLV